MDLTNKIITGHALEVLKSIPEKSVNMCITSPPYWGLRDYKTNPVKWADGWEGELGAESDFNQYINHLCDIFDEVKKVLTDEGTCWVNIGDTYGGSTLNKPYCIKAKGETSFLKGVEHLQKTAHTRGKYEKCLLLIPFRFAIEMVNRGWTIRNVIIWQKPNAVPHSVKDRFTVDFEYIFFFSKNKKYYFEQQFEPFNPATYKRKFDDMTETKAQYFQGLGKKKQFEFHKKLINNELKGRNMRTVWNVGVGSSGKGTHIATYPKKLIESPIKAGCPENGIVLDPFIGSGTTAVVAEKLNRKWLGIELNPEYTKLAEERILKGN